MVNSQHDRYFEPPNLQEEPGHEESRHKRAEKEDFVLYTDDIGFQSLQLLHEIMYKTLPMPARNYPNISQPLRFGSRLTQDENLATHFFGYHQRVVTKSLHS